MQRADAVWGDIDSRFRGIPVDCGPVDLDAVAAFGWRPAAGDMPLPVLTLDEEAFAGNCELMFAYARSQGVLIAPHAKTPMAPALARALVNRGAWGATVANVQQASVMARAGISRLLLANEIGGRSGARHLGAFLKAWPGVELRAFADSPACVAALAEAARLAGRILPVLVEVGGARAGARHLGAVEATIAAVAGADDCLVLDGVAAYEGAVASADAAATREAIGALLALAGEAFARVRAAAPGRHLIATAGGSSYFDEVVAMLGPCVRDDGNASLVLRSGAIFFHDHGVYARALAGLDARGGFAIDGKFVKAAEAFRPALRLWAEVLSRPEPGLAICGMGMRDVSFDQGMPVPLEAFRDGVPLGRLESAAVVKLNDQHAFLQVPDNAALAVGDIVAFGISHPCTCLDRWRLVFGLGPDGRVASVYPTFFG
jgi:Predicted amino acid aldolase or racemase